MRLFVETRMDDPMPATAAIQAATPPVADAVVDLEVAVVRRARNGDRTAFATLHGRYARMVHAILLARVGHPDADDCVQDVFITAWKRLPSLRDEAAFGGWIARIARNAAVDHHRRAPRTAPLPLEEIGRPDPPRAEARQALEAIRSLPEAYRETLLMRLVEGMSGPEIAARTGMTPGSVRVNLHRGMALLREALGTEAVR